MNWNSLFPTTGLALSISTTLTVFGFGVTKHRMHQKLYAYPYLVSPGPCCFTVNGPPRTPPNTRMMTDFTTTFGDSLGH